MLEFRPENFRHACESGDDEAQLYAFWTHSREGLAAARAGDSVTVESCRRALEAMVEFFEGHSVAQQAAAAIVRMEQALSERRTGRNSRRNAKSS
jgi:histidinol-phosphate/aromatic aminotransferase/cobyric acid decarboxylase-like protein